MRLKALLLAASALAPLPAFAQSTPEQILGPSFVQDCPTYPVSAGWGKNCAPTRAIWDALFAAKQDNLTSIFSSIIPTYDNVASLGDPTHRWANIYAMAASGPAFSTLTRACSSAEQAGLVGDGVTLNDTAFNTWWSAQPQTGACLQFGPGKFAFGSQIAKTLGGTVQSVHVASGAYNSTTGIVTLTLSAAATFTAGSPIDVLSISGTGAYLNLRGTFIAASVSGTTVTYQAQAGLGAAAITDGGLDAGIRFTVSILGGGSGRTTLYWPNAGGGISLTAQGTTTAYGSFQNSFHIRDMTIATGQANGGTALNLLGFGYAYGTPPASDLTNLEIQGDDYTPPIGGLNYWSSDVNLSCWSNVNVFNVNTYNVMTGATGVGLKYGCSGGNYAVILNIQQSSFNGAAYGIALGDYWQGVTINQTNINSTNGGNGITLAAGAVGTLAGLTITNSQFGVLPTNCINLAPASGQTPYNVLIANNLCYVGTANSTGIYVGNAANTNVPSQVSVTNNQVVLTASSSAAFGIVAGFKNGVVTGNSVLNQSLSGTQTGITFATGVANVVARDNALVGAFAASINATACSAVSTCRILDNPGYNPVGVFGSIAVPASPATICAGPSPETHYYLQGATNTAGVYVGGVTVGLMANPNIPLVTNLGPGECEQVFWSTTDPTYVKSVH